MTRAGHSSPLNWTAVRDTDRQGACWEGVGVDGVVHVDLCSFSLYSFR